MKYFLISSLGDTPVSRNNAAFMFCKDLDRVDSMQHGETASILFQSGMGTTRGTVTRVEDDYEDRIRQLRCACGALEHNKGAQTNVKS